jgi:hypothetical protein
MVETAPIPPSFGKLLHILAVSLRGVVKNVRRSSHYMAAKILSNLLLVWGAGRDMHPSWWDVRVACDDKQEINVICCFITIRQWKGADD